MDLTFDSAAVRRTAQLIHSLSRDLRRLEARIGPTLEDRLSAAIIEDWRTTYRLELALSGRIDGSVPIATSSLFFLDEAAGCARTLEGWLLLGRRMA